MKKPLPIVVVALSLAFFPAQRALAQNLDVAGISIGLGEPAQDALRRFSNAFTVEYSAPVNGYSIRSGRAIYGYVFVKDGRVVQIRKNFTPIYDIQELPRATASAHEFVSSKTSISSCFVTNKLEGNASLTSVKCGSYVLVYLLLASDRELLYQVYVDLIQ